MSLLELEMPNSCDRLKVAGGDAPVTMITVCETVSQDGDHCAPGIWGLISEGDLQNPKFKRAFGEKGSWRVLLIRNDFKGIVYLNPFFRSKISSYFPLFGRLSNIKAIWYCKAVCIIRLH